MMMVPGASVVRYSTAVRLYSGSNSTESSGRSPGWSPTSGCWAWLCESESIRLAAAIAIQVRCRNFVIQESPSLPPAYLHGLPKHWNHQIARGARGQAVQLSRWIAFDFFRNARKTSLRCEPEPKAIGHDGAAADAAEP